MIHFLLATILFLTSPFPSPREASPLSSLTTFSLSRFQMEMIPGGFYFPTFFENLAPATTFLIEESNGFALLDPPRVYFEGDSITQFSWSVNQFPTSSSLNPGTPGVIPPLGLVSQLQLARNSPLSSWSGMNFCLGTPPLSSSSLALHVSHVWPNMGGMIPGATFMLQPHATTEERDNLLSSIRRQFTHNTLVDLVGRPALSFLELTLGATYFRAERQFNDFNHFHQFFKEPGELTLFLVQAKKKISAFDCEFLTIINHISRENLTAELGRLPQETLSSHRNSIFSGLNFSSSWLRARLSFLREKNNLNPQTINLAKELMDNDGEGFFPFEKWGEFQAKTWRFDLTLPFSFNLGSSLKGQFYISLKQTNLTGKEASHQFNPLLFNNKPYQVIIWQGDKDWQNSNGYFRSGLQANYSWHRDISFYLKLFFQPSWLHFAPAENNLHFWQSGFDFGLAFFEKRRNRIFVAYGLIPWEIRENVNYFLENNRPLGQIYYWSDHNQDKNFQVGEEGPLYRLTRGASHLVSSQLKAPFNHRLLAIFQSSLSAAFTLQLQGSIKETKNNFWVHYKENYGHFSPLGDKSLFILDKPVTQFIFSNYSFGEKPFYAELLLHLWGQKEKNWFFSFSFMAHLGMGYTAFGNGPTANDIGIIDESQASPNTWINGYGRVDGDRAFVGKMFFGFYLRPRLFLSATLKYRDGNPFAFIDSYLLNQEVILTLQTIQAENKKGVKGGPREDYLSDVSLQLSYSWPLTELQLEFYASLHNLLDFGSELSEYVFSGGQRYALELQIPRSLRLGIKASW
ncbi:MAG TPA: hypothetical protein ENF17_05335 [Candidatus Aminicenantes bacterium]|nr:hypothetical protein [Candidatus Aminicenantes bacterium]